ncbi:MAG: BON domain-containing protein [Caldisericia bacterium]|nr:BON domain-containing protein [Caldisericia bacterium]
MDRRIAPSDEKGLKLKDLNILKKIKNLIDKNEALKKEKINITVKSGEVILEGNVSSEKVINEIENLLKEIKSIKKVINNLTYEIKRSLDANIAEESLKILEEKGFKNLNITYKGGVLNIYGNVNNLKEKKQIEKILSNLKLTKINNFIKIKPSFNVNDFIIESLVYDNLKKNKIFNLKIKVLNKVLYLRGNVENEKEREEVLDKASEVPGVIEIINGITLRDEKSIDIEIENNIREILKGPEYSSDKINFISISGNVFLEGEAYNQNTLYSIEEKVSKIKNVKRVINRIIGVVR